MIIKMAGLVRLVVSALFFSAFLAAAVCVDAREETGSVSEVKSTLENLLTAYNNESNAQARYVVFAKKAQEEGFGQVASLFRAAAKAEQIHCKNYVKAIQEFGGTAIAKIRAPIVRTTMQNLETAIKDELYESEVLYPEFAAQAQNESAKLASIFFGAAKETEAGHAKFYKDALNDMNGWRGQSKEFFVCPVCGYLCDVISGPACPVCEADTKTFVKIK